MNLSILSTFITALLALSNAEADSSERSLHRGKNVMAKLQNLIYSGGCDTLTCPAVSPSTAECTFEKPERPSLEGLSEAEIAELKEDMQAKKEEKKEQILKCACCAGFTLEDMMPARTEGEGGSRPSGMSGGGSGSRPQGGGDMMAKLQNLIDNGCDSLTCPVAKPTAVECTFEKPEKPSLEGLTEAEIAQMKEDMQAKKEEKKEQILKCACCAGFALEDMMPARPEGEDGSRPGRVGSLRQSVTVAESSTEGAASASDSADEDDSSADGSTSTDP